MGTMNSLTLIHQTKGNLSMIPIYESIRTRPSLVLPDGADLVTFGRALMPAFAKRGEQDMGYYRIAPPIEPKPTARTAPAKRYAVIPTRAKAIDGTAWALMMAAASADRLGNVGMNALAQHSGSTAWHLVHVLIHEAAHSQIAKAFGLKTEIYISRESLGSGECFVSGLAVQPLAIRRQIGMAGHAADLFAVHGSTASLQHLLIDIHKPRQWSESDRTLTEGSTAATAIASHRKVRSLWPEIIGEASALLGAEVSHHEGKSQLASRAAAARREPSALH